MYGARTSGRSPWLIVVSRRLGRRVYGASTIYMGILLRCYILRAFGYAFSEVGRVARQPSSTATYGFF